MLKFPGTKNEVAGGDFVSKAFTHLGNAERQLFTGCALYVGEVDENPLRCFGAQVDFVFRLFGHALMGFEHKVELANFREVSGTAVGALYPLGADDVEHFGIGQACGIDCAWSSISLSALCRVLQERQSIKGSEKPPTCPDATQT